MAGKCPHCQEKFQANGELIHIGSGIDRSIKCMAYRCAACDVVISVGPNPSLLDNILEIIRRRLGR